MLHEFLSTNRASLLTRCRTKVAQRHAPIVTPEELEFGIPLFLDQVIRTLKVEHSAPPFDGVQISGPQGGDSANSELGRSAAKHGRELSELGFTVEQVVHDYGDLCQAITDMAVELKTPIKSDEFRTLNRCLDNGIADAVTEFTLQRSLAAAEREAQTLSEKLGVLAHELRNHLNTATLAVSAIKSGAVGLSGATGAVLDRSLMGLRTLIDRSLADVRISAGIGLRQRVSVAELIADASVSASLEAKARGCQFVAFPVEPELAVEVDRDMMLSVLANLLQNAFKFTHPHTEVTIEASAQGESVVIDVQDHCGGLPAGNWEAMFLPFTQNGENRTGLGLGLSICRQAVQAQGGTISVHNLPGSGCIFRVELPRHTLP